MDKRIIGKLRTHIKLVVIISAILISGLVFLIGIYIPSIEESKKSYIAIDDTYHAGGDRRETVNGNKAYLIGGRCIDASGSHWFYSYLQFDLTNKPKYWNKCELSIYITEYNRGDYIKEARFIRVVLYVAKWNELMAGYDIRERYYHSNRSDNFYPCSHFRLGLMKINITNYIKNDLKYNESVSIRIGYSSQYEESIIYHSKEANVSKVWLPQLIWS